MNHPQKAPYRQYRFGEAVLGIAVMGFIGGVGAVMAYSLLGNQKIKWSTVPLAAMGGMGLSLLTFKGLDEYVKRKEKQALKETQKPETQ